MQKLISPYTLPVFTSEVSPEIDLAQVGSINSTINEASSTLFPQLTYLTTLVKAVHLQESFKDFWEAYGSAISLVGAGFAAMVLERFKRKERRWYPGSIATNSNSPSDKNLQQ